MQCFHHDFFIYVPSSLLSFVLSIFVNDLFKLFCYGGSWLVPLDSLSTEKWVVELELNFGDLIWLPLKD